MGEASESSRNGDGCGGGYRELLKEEEAQGSMGTWGPRGGGFDLGHRPVNRWMRQTVGLGT